MMAAEFYTHMTSLKEFFGTENYPLAKEQMIWAEVKDLTGQSFGNIVKFFKQERNPAWPPQVSHFREQAAIQRQSYFNRATKAAGQEFLGSTNTPAPRRQHGRQYMESSEGLKKALEDENLRKLHDTILKRKPGGAK